MEIVVEYVLIENLLLDTLIFKTTENVLKIKGKFIIFASFLASIFALILPLFHLTSIPSFFVKILFGALLTSIVFKFSSILSFVKIFFVFLFSTFIYGGVATFLTQTFGELSAILLILSIILSYFALKKLSNFLSKRRMVQKVCCDVTIEVDEKKISCKGFLDTGNLLVDPLTERPVSIIGLKLFKEIFGENCLMKLLTKNVDAKNFKLGHYISLDTVAKSEEVLAFEIDKISIDGKENEKAILALSFKNFPSYEMILNGAYV